MKHFLQTQARNFRKWLLKEAKSEIRSFQQLQWITRHLAIPIPSTGYSLQPSTINYIVNEIMINNRKTIVEFGSGTSTQIIAQCLALIDPQGTERTFISIDENEAWVDYVKKTISTDDNIAHVKLIHLPRVKGRLGNWYDEEKLTSVLENITPDVIVVDGPSVKNVKETADRMAVMKFFKEKMPESFTIFVDDTVRRDERALAKAWSKQENAHLIFWNAYLGVIKKGGGYTSKPN
jgi:hypothetical protein